MKENLEKVCCGIDFSLGLSESKKLYFWGNARYSGHLLLKEDVEFP